MRAPWPNGREILSKGNTGSRDRAHFFALKNLGNSHCLRRNGTEGAWFHAKEEAEAFALHPANALYQGDLAPL
jgi:hypothetical protein